MFDFLQPPDPPVLLFLGTYRIEDAVTSPFPHSFSQIQLQRETPLESFQIEAKPLEQADAVRLALSLMKTTRSAAAIAQETDGDQFFISEVVQHLQLEGERVSDSTEPLTVSIRFDTDVVWSFA